MKYRHALEVNAKELEILAIALSWYKTRLDKFYCSTKVTGRTIGKDFISYRNKINNMTLVLEDIRKMPKPVASERGKIPKTEE